MNDDMGVESEHSVDDQLRVVQIDVLNAQRILIEGDVERPAVFDLGDPLRSLWELDCYAIHCFGLGTLRGGRVGLNRDRQRLSGSSAGCFLEMPIWGVMQGGRSPTGVTRHIGGRIHAAIASGRLSKYV